MHPTNFPETNSRPTNKAEARSVGSYPKRLTQILLSSAESHLVKAFDRDGRSLPDFKALSFTPLSDRYTNSYSHHIPSWRSEIKCPPALHL
jgi:hypothetical protein